jgi:hypothetical protein
MKLIVALVCAGLILAGGHLGCATRVIHPDGSIEESYLDPAWERILTRATDLASAIVLAQQSEKTDPALEAETTEVDVLLSVLDDESAALARDVIEAARAKDYIRLIELLNQIEALKQARKQQEAP